MPDWNLVSRPHVLAAIAECDRLGSREFLSRYRFGRSTVSALWYDGQEYDSHAILGLAYLQATGSVPTRQEFKGTEHRAVQALKDLGFDVVVDEEALAQEREQAQAAPAEPARTSTPAAAKPAGVRKTAAKAAKKPARVKPAEREVKVCPTCYMALPATGICDNCG